MTNQETVIRDLTGLLEQEGIAFMLIGGHANIVWGIPRLTLDVDVTVWASEADLPRLLHAFAPRFVARPSDPVSFVHQTRVLPLRSSEGINVDMIFGLLPFEEEAIQRARRLLIGQSEIPVCTPEDLILMKIVSDRPRDADDIRGIVATRFRELDLGYLEPRIEALADALDSPSIRERWAEWTAHARSRAR